MYGTIGRALGGKLVAVAAAGMLGAGVLGGAAAASTAPEGTSNLAVAVGATNPTAAKDRDGHAGLKRILDALVAKGTITQAQEEAILDAVGKAHAKGKDRDGDRDHDGRRGMLKAAERYLGLTGAQLRDGLEDGKSLGDIANATPGKSRDGLVSTLAAEANARIDAAVAAGKLTADQGADAKAKAAARIAKLVDHQRGPKPAAPRATN